MRMMFAARAIHNMAGGVERMIIAIMNEMVERGHEVALFTWDRAEGRAFYPMRPEIRWYKLGLGDPARRAGMALRLQRAAKVRSMVKEFGPEAIVGFQGGAFRAMLAYTWGLGIPVVAAERTAPSLYEHASTEWNRRIELLSFRFAAAIAVQFDRYRSSYPNALQSKIVETPNPVATAERHAEPGVPGPDHRFTLLSVGRLGYQKNFDVLLEAFEVLADRFPEWDLRIIGEGEDREKLEAKIRASPRLINRVSLPGATKDVASCYVAAHLFCLPSRWEGFPNALAEALAHGLPAVGFAGCSGVADLIETGTTGWLADGVNNAESLAHALAEAMEATERRTSMGAFAVQAMRRYAPSECYDRWEALLVRVRST
ncbi:glycosyltransferase [Rhizobium halophilum]|uniref:glycosyltransferase n=1 Tax=Rhizobium halophilum TaxID=2846852 RepID=UPI001EFC3F3D|nr:glycosyltransferase [Rhizobium halophilum]MCF6368151.1 glycosyltransferase [Rhizobium halophilum]